ncbi:sulfurtransferase Alvin_2599 [Pogona vitticeps]
MADQFLKDLEASGVKEPSEKRSLAIKWVEGIFPGVELVTTETLQQWMETRPEKLLLLDTRTPAEFDVSHLPGALLVPSDANALLEVFKAWSLQEPGSGPRDIVCYCTVGYRSSRAAQLLNSFLAQELAGRDFGTSSKIYNLRGGLVMWGSERRPMVDQQEKPTSVVHPYNSVWARLLEPEIQAAVDA